MSRADRGILALGLMSGTSADSIDVALVRISGPAASPHSRLVAFAALRYPSAVREAILRLANGAPTATREISQLNFRLGEFFADAALRACKRFRISAKDIALVGSHGQTIYHQGVASPFLGARVSSTLQIGEPAIIAERTGITTIADFRVADMAAGGQGAPLVPFVDYLLYRDPRHNRLGRIALNVGGIANLSVIPAGAKPRDVFAFDTGPGNMIVDALITHFSGGRLRFDRNAEFARRGRLDSALLAELLAHPFFRKSPPKTAGREEFGAEYTSQLIALAKSRRIAPANLIHTATAFTAASIAQACAKFVFPRVPDAKELIVAGGGARNPLLVAYLAAFLPSLKMIPANAFGVPADAKEAFAFAVLAYVAFYQHANNLPSATGAHHPAVLGKICYARPH